MTVAAPALEQSPAAAARTSGYVNAVILIVAGVVSTTLAQPQVLARLPLTNLMKNELHLSPTAVSGFFFLCGLPWYLKPFAGIVTDAFPLLGSRRVVYLAASSAIAALGWAAMYFAPHQYSVWLWMCLGINFFMVFASTVLGGFMVEMARMNTSSGLLASIRNVAQAGVSLVNAPAGGYLGSVAFGLTAGLCGGVIFALVPATLLLLREPRVRVDSGKVLSGAGRKLGDVFTAPTVWAAVGLTLFVFLAPRFTTLLFYRQQNELHLNTIGQGWLASVAALAAVLAPFAYILACRRYNLRVMLALSLGVTALSTLGFMFYTSLANAYIIGAASGFASTLAEVALMDLAVRASPVGSEGLGFALIVSMRNVALFGTDVMGSFLRETWHVPFNGLVIANSVVVAIAVPLVFLLPRVLVAGKDAEDAAAEALEGYPEPPTQMQD